MSVQQQSLQSSEQARALARLTRRLHASNRAASIVLWIVAAIVIILFVAIIINLLAQGIPYMIYPGFYGAQGGTGTIGQQLFNTIYILVLSEIFLIPISLAAAIYLTEYAKQGRLVSIIHFAAETLAGVPSIVLGLFGAIVFVSTFHLGLSRLAGALTLLCLNFPIALRLFEDALTSVPRELREGGLALGSTKWHVIRTVVLPSALPGIITGIVLSAGKIVAEAAALIYTMGTSNPANVLTLNPMISGDTLTIHIWAYKTVNAGDVPTNVADAVSAGSSALLIIILLVINIAARAIGRVVQRAVTAE